MNSVLLKKSLIGLCLIGIIAMSIISCSKKDDAVVKSRELTLTFDSFTIVENTCDQSFTKDNITFSLESSYGHEGDCATTLEGCAFENDPDGMWIGYGRAVFDVSKLGALQRISVGIVDYGHTQIVLYDRQGEPIATKENTESSELETITFDSNLDNVYSFSVSSCECLVKGITINYES